MIAIQRRPNQIPLSYSQQGIWFIDRLRGGSTEYNMQCGMRLRGVLDDDAFRRAVALMIKRHESLRTHFEEYGGEPCQIITSEAGIDFSTDDLSSVQSCDQAKA